jgi:hypothetical protein
MPLAEANVYLPNANEAVRNAFQTRQLAARKRYKQLFEFYRANPCRVARIHLLTGAAVTLGRFCGVSQSFDAIGRILMPVDEQGTPKNENWNSYAEACQQNRPWRARDELWIKAHLEDMEAMRQGHLDDTFYAEADGHQDDPVWNFLRLHMEMTLGARLTDHLALAGHVPVETVISDGIAMALSRIVRSGFSLLFRYAKEGTKALLGIGEHKDASAISYRRTALQMIWFSFSAWSAAKVFRLGVRNRERGHEIAGDAWPLLKSVLGTAVEQVHPLIVKFYTNPSLFNVKAQLELFTPFARFWSFVAAQIIGQGLYETKEENIPTLFQVFRRTDGSMHFIRKLMLPGTERVFDSDFLVKDRQSNPTLFEVFPDIGVAVPMKVTVLPNGGLSIRGLQILFFNFPVPDFGLKVEFISTAVSENNLHIDGHLRMEPTSKLGKFLAYKVLRRPRDLGCIHYRIETKPNSI